MNNKKIDEATMDKLELLSKLSLSNDERKSAMCELEKLLSYVDKLNEVDTENVEPLTHILPRTNVYREDEVTNGDGTRATLMNGKATENDMFIVPKTV